MYFTSHPVGEFLTARKVFITWEVCAFADPIKSLVFGRWKIEHLSTNVRSVGASDNMCGLVHQWVQSMQFAYDVTSLRGRGKGRGSLTERDCPIIHANMGKVSLDA